MLKSKQMAYTFTTDGDYVIFSETTRIDGSYIRKLAKTSKAVEWSYDDSTPVTISFNVDNLDYRNVRIGDIIIDGETMTTTAGFETAIGTIFPSLASSGATEVTVYQRKVIIADAAIRDLAVNPAELVPAPGAGKMLIFQGAIVLAKITVANGYSGAGTNASDYMYIGYGGDAACSTFATLDLFTGNNLTGFEYMLPYTDTIPISYPNHGLYDNLQNCLNKNLALRISNSLSLTGGNAANTLEVTIFYSVVDI